LQALATTIGKIRTAGSNDRVVIGENSKGKILSFI
jgi:hypothetical protein